MIASDPETPPASSPADRLWQELLESRNGRQATDSLADVAAFMSFLAKGDVAGYRGDSGERKSWKDIESLPDADLAAELPRAVNAYVSDHRMPGGTAFTDGLRPARVGFWRSLATLDAEGMHMRTFEELHTRYADLSQTPAPKTSLELAAVVSSMISPINEGGILDPACGTGNLLLSLGKKMGMAAACAGQEADPALARIAAYRLDWNGGPSTPIAVGDSLRDDHYSDWRGGHAGSTLVVCDPPTEVEDWGREELSGDIRWEFGCPPDDAPEFAWLQHCYAHLRPGGTAFVIMPAEAASRRSCRDMREEMLRGGALHEIIALPPVLSSSHAGGSHLWILDRPSAGRIDVDGEVIDQVGPARSVHMTDASGFDREQLRRIQRDSWSHFRDEPGSSTPVAIADLLDGDIDLAPSRYVHPPETNPAATLARAMEGLAPLTESLPDLLPPNIDPPGSAGSMPQISVAELERTGEVGVILNFELPRIEVSGLRPGDVLISAVDPMERPVVVTEHGGDPTADRHLLRCEPDVLDPHFLAAFLHSQAVTGLASFRYDVRQAYVPRIPLGEQRRYGDAFRSLATFVETARRVASLSDDMMTLAATGLATGPVRRPDPQKPHN